MTTTPARSAAVLISGGGSNLQALIDATRDGLLALDIVVVVSNRPNVAGLDRARRAGIATECIISADSRSRDAFDNALTDTLDAYRPDLLLLAGFMRILTPACVQRYSGRMLNIHPSLLPDYPGLDTHRRVLEAGDRWHGCTVHFVTEDLDGGPAIMQGRVPVMPDDNAEGLAARVLSVEHRIYPRAAALLASGRLEWRNGNVLLDGQPLLKPLQLDSIL
ncbi:MAG TPA: phosphoribosylglycinamide formyltransferase [Woeseiaceae bacterium]